MEHVVIWAISFIVVISIVISDEAERILAKRVKKMSRDPGILGMKQNSNMAAGTQFITVIHSKDEDEIEKESIIVRIQKQVLEYITSYKNDLRSELQKAGIRSPKSLEQTFRTSILLSLLLAFVLFMQMEDFLPEIFELPMGTLIAIGISGYGGFYIATSVIKKFILETANTRRDAIEEGIPDLLDIMVICAEAGFDIQKILQKAAKEIAISNKTLADELQHTNAEFKLSANFYQILKNLEERTESLKVQSICNIIIQSIEMGTSLTDSLKTLSHDIRNERSLKAEEQAGKVPNKITIPLLLFIMPCLFIIILAPMLLKASGTFAAGGS